MNLRKWLCPKKDTIPEYKPTFRRKMTPDDFRIENLGKCVWWRAENNACLDDGIFVGYDSAYIVVAEERTGLYRPSFVVAVEGCWIEMESEEEQDD